MRSLNVELPFRQMRNFFLKLIFAVALVIGLSVFLSRSLFAVSGEKVDSLAESAKREFVSALLLSVKGEHHDAALRLQTILKSDPSNAAVNYALSRAFLGVGLSDSARIYSEKSVKLDSLNTYYLQYLAALSHQMNDYQRAAKIYQRLLLLEPGHPQYRSLLALEYLSADQPEKALSAFQENLRLNPMNETAQAQVLLLELKLRHYQDAIGTLRELIDQGEGKEKLRLTLGELYLQTSQYDLAYTTLRALLRENPRFVPAWLTLFEVSVQSGNNKTFLDDLHRFYKDSQVTIDLQIDLARLFLSRASRDKSYSAAALAMTEELSLNHPKNSAVYLLRGQARLQREDTFGGVSDIRKALVLAPDSLPVYEALVTAYVIGKDFNNAALVLLKAKKRFPSRTIRLQVLEGELYFQQGKLMKSALLLEKVLQSINVKKEKGLFIQATGILASCYDKQGFSDKSIRRYEAILDIDPGNALIMNNIAYTLAEQGKNLARARELAMKAVAAEPSNASFLDTLGWILFRIGEFEKSREYLEKAAAIDQREAEIFDHLAQLYEKLGNPLKASEMREKARKLKGKL
jgi:tetratricopeptide (TPR) repeat protein